MPRKYNPKSKANLKPFKPDNPVTGEKDERINRQGRAKSFDELRKVFQEIANEEVTEGKITKTRLRKIGETLARSQKSMKDFLEFGYGKVPLSQIIKVDEHKEISWKEFINGYGNDSDPSSSSE
jgi:hypothetical protein